MNWILCRAVALLIGFLGEQQIGWPRKWYHPIMAVGSLISGAERMLRAWFPKSKAGERAAGIVMASALPLLTLGVSGGMLYLLYRWSWIAGLLVESAMCWSIFASGSLRDAAQEVETGLSHSVEAGRQASSGRRWRRWRKISPTASLRPWSLRRWAGRPEAISIKRSIRWIPWWATEMTGTGISAPARPGWTMCVTQFPPGCRRF